MSPSATSGQFSPLALLALADATNNSTTPDAVDVGVLGDAAAETASSWLAVVLSAVTAHVHAAVGLMARVRPLLWAIVCVCVSRVHVFEPG